MRTNLLISAAFVLNYCVRTALNAPTGYDDATPRAERGLRGSNDASASSAPKLPPLKDSVEPPWSDLDLSSAVGCGSHRCFVPSLSDDGAGYVIARAEEAALAGMAEATDLAPAMERDYGAKTFYLPGERPVDASMPDDVRSKLNDLARNPLRERRFPATVGANGAPIEEFYDEPNAVVQRTTRADPSSLLAHCADNGFTLGQLAAFLAAVEERYGEDDLGEFAANLARDRYRTHALLIDMPELAADLQVLVSPEGELHFLDFGGHAAWTEKDRRILTVRPKEELCGESFDMILDALENYEAFVEGGWKWKSRRYHRQHS
ncbi:hypothetical protein ACHAWF_010498 [Thalassiosira exigua]